MDKQLRLAFLLLLTLPCAAQFPLLPGVVNPPVGTSTPGPFNLYVEDFNGGTNLGTPTSTTLCAGFFPGATCPTGASFTVTNPNSLITYSNTESYAWPAFTLTGGSWPNTSTLSGLFTTGTAGNNVSFTYPTAVQATVSKCTPVYTDIGQSTAFSSRIDYDSLLQSTSLFNTFQFSNAGSSITINTECGGTSTGGNCTGGEGTNGNMPTGTWQILGHIVNNTTGTSYSAVWNAPTSGSPFTTGTLVANSLVTNTSSTTGGTSQSGQVFGSGGGSGAGPATGHFYVGSGVIYCGLDSTQTACGFPAAPFLQLLNPTDSPGSGNYGSSQTVTVTNPSSATDTYCYTTCSTAGCTPTAPTASNGSCTSGTTYSGSFTATPPEAISYIATRNGNMNSSVFTSDYVSPNAAYVNSSQCSAAAGSASCTITLSVTSGNLITVCSFAPSSSNTLTYADSNSDTPSYTAHVTEATDNYHARCGLMKAGAAVTTITCTQSSPTGHIMDCFAASYSPNTLAGSIDQSTGQDQPNTTLWTSGSTSMLSGSSDLVIGYWALPFTGATSTYSDGSTQRITFSANYSGGLTDRTGWGTVGPAASGTWSSNGYGIAIVMAIK